METLPWELIAQIGANLLPKWRCRLYLCTKLWYSTCYSADKWLFDWCRKNKLIAPSILGICRTYYSYKRLRHEYGTTLSVAISIIPSWKNRRILYIYNHNNRYLFIRSKFCAFNCNYGVDRHIYRFINNQRTALHWYNGWIIDYWQDNLQYDTGVCKLIYNNLDDIMKYLDIHEKFKLWVALGFYYYHAIRNIGKYNILIKDYKK
jgi:hypothetical protein